MTSNSEVVTRKECTTKARVFVCRWGRSFAIISLHDETGLLSIVSDLGTWVGVWPPLAHGCESLHHFLSTTDGDYVSG